MKFELIFRGSTLSARHEILFVGGRKKCRLFCLVVFLLVFLFTDAMSQGGTKTDEFKISSSAFEKGGEIPQKYTCNGENVNPALQFEYVPAKAKSLALVLDDMDAPRGSYVHWILWNIHSNTKEIKENSVPEGAVQGMNGFKKQNYGGPCPPRRAHRYVFKIYALDIFLNLDPRSAKTDLEKAMEDHVIAQAQLMGVYKRVNASQKINTTKTKTHPYSSFQKE